MLVLSITHLKSGVPNFHLTHTTRSHLGNGCEILRQGGFQPSEVQDFATIHTMENVDLCASSWNGF
jgi:hypothetical protein